MERRRRDRETYELAHKLYASGTTVTEVARTLGLPRGTVQNWLVRRPAYLEAGATSPVIECHLCADRAMETWERWSYAYLLGLYLGDGSIAVSRRKVFRLCVHLDSRYPGIVQECRDAMTVFHRTTNLLQRDGCTMVSAYSVHWPCYFPQHGPGRKHLRDITLEQWQQAIADEFPEALVRGLIHSDGCRVINRVRGGRYAYPRYQFSNRSAQIAAIYRRACDALGVRWTATGWSTDVSRRDSVAILDAYVGPKA